MKKRLVLQWLIIMIASTLDAALAQQNCSLSRIYNQRFTPQVNQSATIGSSGSLDETFNESVGSF